MPRKKLQRFDEKQLPWVSKALQARMDKEYSHRLSDLAKKRAKEIVDEYRKACANGPKRPKGMNAKEYWSKQFSLGKRSSVSKHRSQVDRDFGPAFKILKKAGFIRFDNVGQIPK
jgi:hypothetical protein